MLILYPPLKAYAEHRIEVGSSYNLYLEESGNPKGVPILFLNDGPGLGTQPCQRCLFDPQAYRIILFDSRGTGHSTPHADITANTTTELLADIESVRNHLGINQWIIFGSGWGTTLALLYAQANPQQTLGLILQSVFLGRPPDCGWAFKIARELFPNYWQTFVESIAEKDRDNLLTCFFERLTGDDDLLRMATAKTWAAFFAKCSTLELCPKLETHYTQPFIANSFARIACYYLLNKYFLVDNQILNNIHHLKYIPGIIIHGHYDLINSCENAWTLHQHWPEADLKILRCAGHNLFEAPTIHTTIQATKEMLKIYVA
jgi:proline iminopeptidase